MVRREYDDVTVPVIIQTVGGDLRLRGRPGKRLIIDGDGAEVEQLGASQPYLVRCSGDARIIVPDYVAVTVKQVGGDTKVTEVGGALDIHSVGGDLIVRSVRTVLVKTVGGDLRLKRSDGMVTIENVGRDATIRDVSDDVWVTNIGSDLYMRNINRNCVVENVGADLVLNINFSPENEYRFGAGNDILCRVKENTNATFNVPPETHLNLEIAASIGEDDEGMQSIMLGDGSAAVFITDADTLRLVGEDDDYMINFGVEIEEELEARLSTLEDRLSQQLEGLDERIQAKATIWASQAERVAERAQRQAERAVERVRQSMERNTKQKRGPGPRRINLTTRVDTATRDKESDPVSEQERLLILQMVQDGRITIEEAERLLAALDS